MGDGLEGGGGALVQFLDCVLTPGYPSNRSCH